MAVVAVSTISAAVAEQVPACVNERRPMVRFRAFNNSDYVHFDPLEVTPRYDVDVLHWATRAGQWPTTNVTQSNASKVGNGAITGFIVGHLSKGFPSPASHIQLSEAIALRNAKELAEHLGRSGPATIGGWPRFKDIQLLPKPGHHLIESDLPLHIDDLPIAPQRFASLPIGNHALVPGTQPNTDYVVTETAQRDNMTTNISQKTPWADVNDELEPDDAFDIMLNPNEVASLAAADVEPDLEFGFKKPSRRRRRRGRRKVKEPLAGDEEEAGSTTLITNNAEGDGDNTDVEGGAADDSDHGSAKAVSEDAVNIQNLDEYYNNTNGCDEREKEDSIVETSGFDLSLAYSDSELGEEQHLEVISNDGAAHSDASTGPSASEAAPAHKFGLTARQRLRIKQERSRIRRTLLNIRNRREKGRRKNDSIGCHEFDELLPVIHAIGETIVDTGSGEDLVSRWIAEMFPNFITKTGQPITLSTAKGAETCDEQLHFIWKQIGEAGRALVLPDTPSVLSVGRRCIDHGWHFEWPPFSYSPFMIKPDGEIIWLIVRHYVPFLRDEFDPASGQCCDNVAYARAAAARRKYIGKQPPDPEDAVRTTLQDDIPEVDANGVIPEPPEPGSMSRSWRMSSRQIASRPSRNFRLIA